MLFDLTIPRYAIRSGNNYEVDDDGLLVGESWWSSTSRIALSDLLEGQSFILLGEPGIGKSTAIGNAVGAEAGVTYVALDEVASVDMLRLRLTPSAMSEPIHTLVLDGLDECPVPLKALTRHVLDRIRDDQSLRVIVGCRTSDWYEPLGVALRKALDDCPTLELLPLSVVDIERLAADRGCDGSDFVRAVRNSATGPLAGLPLTLDLLIRVFETEGDLPGAPSDLYEQGLRTLVEEPDAGRSAATTPAGSAAERFAVASRIAAMLMLCGISSISRLAADDAQTLNSRLLIGGVEPMPAGDVPVSGELVGATLSTGVFSGRGESRLGPRHASFGAYLTARYLDAHRLPEHQLRALLTRTSTLGRTSVPTRLRETAAWLVSLDPERNGWLVELDPDAALAHAALITDPALRSQIVAYLLDHPRAERQWARRRWRLNFDGLIEQLREPLSGPLREDTGPHLGHPVARRAHTAVEIARSSRLFSALPEIRALVGARGLNPVLRASAAHALVDLDPDGARPILRSLLPELADHPEHDPDDELRGLALRTCWPRAISAGELIAAVGRPGRENFIGSYAMFLDGLVENTSEDNVLDLIRAIAARRTDGAVVGASPMTVPALFGESSSRSRRARRLATSLLERVVATGRLDQVLDEAGWLLANVASLHEKAEVPRRLLDRQPDGSAARLRRGLVQAALRYVSAERAPMLLWTWRIPSDVQPSWGRGGLLCGDDLSWLFDLGTELGLADHAAALLSVVFDPDEPEQQEVAWAHRNSALFSRTVGWWFEPVELNGERAAELRERHQSVDEGPSWEGAESHFQRVEEAWRRCRQNEYEAFRTLCLLLWTDPNTGLSEFQNDAPEGWPSSAVVPFDQATFDAASLGYLRSIDPSGEDWTRTISTISWTALVGYAALRERVRSADPGSSLAELSDHELACWAVAIVRCPFRVLTEAADLHAQLIAELVDRVPGHYARICAEWVSLALAAGERPPQIGSLQRVPVGRHVDRLVELIEPAIESLDVAARNAPGNVSDPEVGKANLQEVQTAQESVRSLLGILADVGRPTSSEWGRIAGNSPEGRSLQSRAVIDTSRLHKTPTFWSRVLGQILANPAYGEAFALETTAERLDPPWWKQLPDGDLGTLASWLIDRWGVDVVQPERSSRLDQIRDWRDGVLNELAARATADALATLEQLRNAHTTSYRLAQLVEEAEERQRDDSWQGPSPDELTNLIQDARRSFIADEDDLYRLLLSVAGRLHDRLQHVGQLLWNEARLASNAESISSKTGTVWSPKYEADISAFVSDHLQSEFVQGVVVNREVLVRQTSSKGHGLAVDVLATGVSRTAPVVVPIEIKGNWNAGLMDDLTAQLAGDYLPALGAKRGIYLCAWFDPDDWDVDDGRRRVAAGRDREQVIQELQSQAARVELDGVEIAVVVVDVPRPKPSTRAKQNPT